MIRRKKGLPKGLNLKYNNNFVTKEHTKHIKKNIWIVIWLMTVRKIQNSVLSCPQQHNLIDVVVVSNVTDIDGSIFSRTAS